MLTILNYLFAPTKKTGLNVLIAYADFGHQTCPYPVYFQLLVLGLCSDFCVNVSSFLYL